MCANASSYYVLIDGEIVEIDEWPAHKILLEPIADSAGDTVSVHRNQEMIAATATGGLLGSFANGFKKADAIPSTTPQGYRKDWRRTAP